MYRIMKKTILSIAVIAAAVFTASCQKENLQENTASEGSASIFTATIENGADTKTTVERIGGNPAIYKTYWESTDQISIDGSIYTATPDDTDKTKATFNKTSGADPTAPFHAYFPASMYSGSKAILLETYDYEDGKYNMPMYAESSTMDLSFKNLCGVLAIKVFGANFTSVTSIEVSSDKQMNGEFTAAADGTLTFKTEGVSLTDDNRKVTLNFTSAKSIAADGSATFYIPVPAADNHHLTIKVFNGSVSANMVTTKTGGVKIDRNMVYPINFLGLPYVEIGGKKWATMNLGATTVADNLSTCAGDYYQWGSVNTLYGSITWSGNTGTFGDWNKTGGFIDGNRDYITDADLSNTNDVVYQKVGGGWRMPTKQDFANLLKEGLAEWTSDYKGVAGIIVWEAKGSDAGWFKTSTYSDSNKKCKQLKEDGTGYNGYTDHTLNNAGYSIDTDRHVFFPAAGKGSSTNLTNLNSLCTYYSSSYSGYSGKALVFAFNNTMGYLGNTPFYDGCTIRPVKD